MKTAQRNSYWSMFASDQNRRTTRCGERILHPLGRAGSAVLLLFLLVGLAAPALAVTPKLAAGDSHTVALKSDATVWAWGRNVFGQVGDGTTLDRTTPVQVSGLNAVTSIAAGGVFTAALKGDGTMWAWGNNDIGELGNGNPGVNSTIPVQVPGLTGVMAIAAGQFHVVALKNDGTVWAWGYNAQGQVGDGTTINRYTAVQVSGLTGITAIGAGTSHTVALKNDGTVWAWGNNEYGQLGDGTDTQRVTPVQVSGLLATAITAGGSHTAAVKSDGTVWCWGRNYQGQLGNGSSDISYIPVKASVVSSIIAIEAGAFHTVALKNDGTVWAWGNNSDGQLGNGSTVSSTTPVQVSGVSGITVITAGDFSTMAAKSDGTVWAWGSNDYGQLGIGTTYDRFSPLQVTSLTGVTAIAAGNNFNLAVQNGAVWCWGDNADGQLGNAASMASFTPVQASGLSGVIAVAAGYFHSVAVKGDGTVWAWGSNIDGQLGDGGYWGSSTPVQSLISGVTAVAAGDYHTVALKSDGTVWTWGLNYYGELGNGTNTDTDTPGQVPGLSGMIAVVAGSHHSMALKSDGTIWTWGYNSDGELGNGTTTHSNLPVQVTGLSGVVAIDAGGFHSVAVTEDRTMWAWGANGSGELGNGGYDGSSIPLQVSGLTDASTTGVGLSHTLAVMGDGTVWAWGQNLDGQLGNDFTGGSALPVQIFGFNGVAAMAGGLSHSLALKSDGTVWNWGYGGYGQLGFDPGWSPLQAQINLGGQQQYDLSVTENGTGTGSVSLSSGEVCAGDCTYPITAGTVVVVTANPNVSSNFSGWAGCDTASGATCTVTMNAAKAVTVTFDIKQFNLNFSAAPGGTLTGTTSQTVNYGGSSSVVNAVANSGYRFVNWTGDNGFVATTQNPLTLTNVTASHNITANFEQVVQTFTVTFVAGAHGSVSGTTTQTVASGEDTTPVTAVPQPSPFPPFDSGYHFVNWTGTNGFVTTTQNPLTVSNVTASMTIMANFAQNTYILTFAAGTGGTINGTTPQTISYNGISTSVTAVPNTGYRFVNWTGDNGFATTTSNPLMVKRVAKNYNIMANFQPLQLNVTFTAGAHGSVSGTTSQTVNYGGSTSAVTAIPAAGYQFSNWTGNNGFVTSTQNPLTVTDVTASQKIKANFVRSR